MASISFFSGSFDDRVEGTGLAVYAAVERFVDWFLSISAVWAVVAVFLVPALETAVVLGLMFPGEVTIILGGVLAAQGDVPLLAILVAAVVGPITGDTIG